MILSFFLFSPFLFSLFFLFLLFFLFPSLLVFILGNAFYIIEVFINLPRRDHCHIIIVVRVYMLTFILILGVISELVVSCVEFPLFDV